MTRQARQLALREALHEHPDTPLQKATQAKVPARGALRRFASELADAFAQVFSRRPAAGKRLASAGSASPGRGARRPATAGATAAERRNRVILAAGLALSAALAIGMGVWLSTHKAPVRAMPAAKPSLTSPSP